MHTRVGHGLGPSMGWVGLGWVGLGPSMSWVGLGWVGSEFFNFWWVGLGRVET